MIGKKSYIFTNKQHTEKGIMSTILGVLSCLTIGTAVYLSFMNRGAASARLGAAVFLAILFLLVGMVLGIWSTTETEKFRLFTILGIAVNTIAVFMLSLILFAGAYVD